MNSRAKNWNVVLGYLLAAIFLAWVFHDIEFGRLFANLGRINWLLVALGMAGDILSYICQGARWHFLLKPVGNIAILRTVQATYAGLFINEVLPMRIGEPARAYLVSRWLPAAFIRVIPSMALERLFEGIWLAVGIGVTAIFVPLPRNLVRAGDILGLVVLAGAAAFVLYVIRVRKRPLAETPALEKSPGIWPLIRKTTQSLVRGFGEIGLTRYTAAAFVATFLLFLFQAFSFWSIMLAYHIHLSFWVGAAVFLIVHFGTSLPNAPANVGAYQFFCVLGLRLFGVDKTLATGFSIVVFILLTMPLLVIGFFAFGRSGLALGSLREKLRNVEAKTQG